MNSRLRFSQVKPLRAATEPTLSCVETFLLAADPFPDRGHDFYLCTPDEPRQDWLDRWPQVTWLRLKADQTQNGKAATLALGERYWSGDIFVISDADMTCRPDYLLAVLGEFSDPEVGVSTCLYRGVPNRGVSVGSVLESLCILDFASSVLVAEKSEGVKFAMGSTMAIRREVLHEIGGFEAVQPYLADDFQLGKRATDRGWRVAIAPTVLDTELDSSSFLEALAHQYRWMVTSRVSRPLGHLAFIITQGLPWSAGLCLLNPSLGGPLLMFWCLLRIALGAVQSSGVRGARSGGAVWELLFLPLKDVIYLGLWVASLLGSTVKWGEQTIEVDSEGRIKNA